ncbi:PAS domain protein [Kalmanozyma brasiliensis GHG001]|uniref:PAS domain-containing protein n=1 Tax=Kalmanozyma brasiliensis (strain GHG001) TaxID=1365824 RepID=V5ET16_KALBG|nr:PAS domain protein [Kalmanozyma brasiliensis GHG001]EST05104.1 PAS domain protein [Kalmanozyma brasiliensis GHG001]
MADTFDFDAFISSPSHAEVAPPAVPNNNGASIAVDNLGNTVSTNASALLGPHNDMVASFSDQGMQNINGGLDMMAGGTLMSQSNSLMYGSNYGESFGNDLMDSWDMGSTTGAGNGAPNFGFGAAAAAAPPPPPQDAHTNASVISQNSQMPTSGPAPAVAPAASGAKRDITASYRDQIAAHHSHLLGTGSRSTSSIPRVSTFKRVQPPMNRGITVTNAARANLSLQERRRLSRQAAKMAAPQPQPQQPQQAFGQASQHAAAPGVAAFPSVAGRGAKRSLNDDMSQISSGPLPIPTRSVSFMNDSSGSSVSSSDMSPQKMLDSRSNSFAPQMPAANVGGNAGASAEIYQGNFSTSSGDAIPTSNKYSSSGVDVLGILSRAITRPNQSIALGPVDLSCSFAISDARHPEQPLIYASETFCHLTGYTLHEILGKNCRFLQTPGVPLEAGAERQHTDNRAVEHLKRHLGGLRECQASLINYRKDGSPFINLVTVVPVSWSDPSQVDFLVGFQVDLVEQPGAILERKDDGSYLVNYRSINDPPPSAILGADELGKDADADASKQALLAADILDLIHGVGPCDAKQWSRVLLENSHDLIYVLSLKGTFLYVSPSIERILGYTADEVIGKSISEFCHPSDVVPVFRELKDSTSNASIAAAASRNIRTEGVANPLTKGGGGQAGPRVNLIMRMRHKHDGHRWIESTGKLHLEQGKGRKVVISSGRPRPVYNLAWEHVRRGAESAQPSFWSKLSIDGIFLNSTGPVAEVLNCDERDIFGRHVLELTNYEAAPSLLQALRSSQAMSVSHLMGDGAGNNVPVFTSFYPSSAAAGPALPTVFMHVQRASAESSWMIPNVAYPKGGPQPAFDATGTSIDSLTSVFAELSTYRSSSWVFEMHQLKNVNRRLKDEIRALRRQSRDHLGANGQGLNANGVQLSTPQTPTMANGRRRSGPMDGSAGFMGNGQGPSVPHIQTPSPIKRRPDHGHGHRQHLRPTAQLSYLHAGHSTDYGSSSSSGSEFSPFPERAPNDRRSGSGDASDETAATTTTSGDTSEKDGGSGTGSGSESRRNSGSAES